MSHLFAASTHFSNNALDASLVDNFDTFCAHTKLDPAVLARDKKAL